MVKRQNEALAPMLILHENEDCEQWILTAQQLQSDLTVDGEEAYVTWFVSIYTIGTLYVVARRGTCIVVRAIYEGLVGS
jgi:hypothetical protein